jgi:hypothetical protein
MTLLAIAQGAVVLAMPSAPLIALGLWWNSNTISHSFIHRPFFRRRAANQAFNVYQSVLLGIPQALWRDRHLAHHAGVRRPLRVSGELALQAALVGALWTALAARAPAFFLSVYLPGYAAGLLLCALHGYYEHARGVTSYYGHLYNVLFFNDGYHVEHHAHPAAHWSRLPEYHEPAARASAWPAPLRWMEALSLSALERLVLRSPILQRFVVRVHARAFRAVAFALPRVERVAIVGGGLFPRTALVLKELLPAARLTIIDADRENLDRARALLGVASGACPEVEFIHAYYAPADRAPCDLLVIPLSFGRDRAAIYAHPPAPAVIVHDWIWRPRGTSRIVSFALLKRINLITMNGTSANPARCHTQQRVACIPAEPRKRRRHRSWGWGPTTK